MGKPGQVAGLLLFSALARGHPLPSRHVLIAAPVSVPQLHSKGYDTNMGAFDGTNPWPSRRWSDRRQTSQQDVSEGLGVANAIEASNLDQLTSEDGL
jgi:hypothetical protein